MACHTPPPPFFSYLVPCPHMYKQHDVIMKYRMIVFQSVALSMPMAFIGYGRMSHLLSNILLMKKLKVISRPWASSLSCSMPGKIDKIHSLSNSWQGGKGTDIDEAEELEMLPFILQPTYLPYASSFTHMCVSFILQYPKSTT